MNAAPGRRRLLLAAALALAAAPAGTVAGPAAAARGAGAANPGAVADYAPGPGTHPVEVVEYDWVDQDRNRRLPARIYFPRKGAGPFPVIVISHDLGGGRGAYEYLGRYWANHGYVTVHLQHAGSDVSMFTPQPGQQNPDRVKVVQQIGKDRQLVLTRALDVYFAFDQIEGMQQADPLLRGRLNLKQMAVAGHGLGAWTALTAAGLGTVAADGQVVALPDPRIKAVLLLSVPVAKENPNLTYAQVKVPCLEIIAAHPAGPPASPAPPPAAPRRRPFDQVTAADQYLVTFAGADPAIFAGRAAGAKGGERDPVYRQAIEASSTAFWDAYLKGNAKAKAWLSGGGLEAALGGEGKLDKKVR
jgi:dienelactone hydrolase